MIRFGAECLGLYLGYRLVVRLHIITRAELQEFGLFCGCMLLMLLVARLMPRLRRLVGSWGERNEDGQT